MKTLQTLLATLVCGMLGAEDVKDRYSHEESSLERLGIERGRIKELPKSITYSLLDDNRHQFTISGLYPCEESSDPKDFESYCSNFFLAEAETEFAVKDSVLTITSKLPISYDWLAWAIEVLGSASGIMPTWFELEARDLPTSEHYNENYYTLEEMDGAFPEGLAWYGINDESELRLPFSTCLYSSPFGTLVLGPSRARAPEPAKFSIRILDENDKIIWKQEELVQGNLQIAVGARDKTGSHRLYVEVSDYNHQNSKRHVLRFRSESGRSRD